MRTTLFLLALSFASPVRAELLYTFEHTGYGPDMGTEQPVSITVQSANPAFLLGSESLTPADVGTVFTADAEQLWAIQQALTIGGGVGMSTIYPGQTIHPFSITSSPYGYGLNGYRLTEVTQTIDRLEWVHEHGTVYAIGAQTVSLYGELSLGGDFNLDGLVDAADYVTWRSVGRDASAFAIWKDGFGSVPQQAAGLVVGGVPEPSSVVLLLLAVHAIGLCLRWSGPRRKP